MASNNTLLCKRSAEIDCNPNARRATFCLHETGFTLIELLVVIGIISFLTTVIFATLGTVRIKARDVARVNNMRELRTVIEAYHADNGFYPTITPKRCECNGHPNDYIPGVVPKYISHLPSDPALNCAGIAHSWCYASNGVDYKLITHIEGDYFPSFADPAWDGGPNNCIVDGTFIQHYAIWTQGAVCWSL